MTRPSPPWTLSTGERNGMVVLMPEESALTDDERKELERLRAEAAILRSRVPPDGAAGDARLTAGGRPARQRWRTMIAVLLIVVACVLAPLSVVAVWTKNFVSDTDRYVQTVAPLASDPDIQNSITNRITTEIFKYVDVQALTVEAADALDRQGAPRAADGLRALAGPIANGVQSFTRTQVANIVASDTFAQAWVQANQVAHEQLVSAMTGEGGGALTVKDDTVSVNLAPFI